ncbi:sodium:proton antiporter [Sporosarcina sp. PTS2304]|uniref:cation:proton antiporter n=1 Tax=Sporosarcina sp. PTS2304 TaxID=2283194 RepID=UPI000E0D98F1|nr:sodium:proton antiporter [Sporosarcina sp. PTS2304]AXI01052.1 sodium:proton antiporter [Sporosarcina sp. PTS2304]
MFDSLVMDLMLVVLIGVGSQWVAWRTRMPAIVVMAIAGLLVGPIFGLINPQQSMGELYGPIITFAVAIILFEGSLNLDFKEIKGFGRPVARIVTIGAFIAWIAGSLAAHFIAGLSLEVAFIIGGLFIVTGPTVILPLLRQARLKPRAAAILKWEGIVVDPFGALLAVFAFEVIKFINDEVTAKAMTLFIGASLFSVLLGWGTSRILGNAFEKGKIPEYLKAPILFGSVLFVFVLSDEIMHETGLLAVTAMGMTMANMSLTTLQDIRHFKENISVLLISGIFVMLTASLDPHILIEIVNPKIMMYVLAMLFIVRPLSIWVSTIGTDLTVKEKTLIGWIAPRGIVALTVSGYFATILLETGYKDAELLTALTFALVFSTVVVHGFSIGWLAKKLNLATPKESGVVLIGSSRFVAELAKSITEAGHKVLIMDDSWGGLSNARKLGIPTYMGDILSEHTGYHLDLTPYRYIAAMTKMDSYNSHVCADFTPDLGRDLLFQTSTHKRGKGQQFNLSTGQILFTPNVSIHELDERVSAGYVFRKTLLTKQYSYTQYLRERDDKSVLLYIIRANGEMEFYTAEKELQAQTGDTIVALSTLNKTIERTIDRLEEKNGKMAIKKEIVETKFLEDPPFAKPEIPGEAPPKIDKMIE